MLIHHWLSNVWTGEHFYIIFIIEVLAPGLVITYDFLPSFCYTFCPLRHRLSGIKKSNGTFFSAPDSHFVNKCLFCDAGGQNIENPNKNMFISNNKAYQEISNFNRYGCPMHFFVRDISLYTTLPGVLYY